LQLKSHVSRENDCSAENDPEGCAVSVIGAPGVQVKKYRTPTDAVGV
jgi:hypothetical protein